MRKSLFLLLCTAALSCLAADYKAPSTALLPQALNVPKSASAAKWLWFQTDKIANFTTARYRKVLILPENDKVVKAEFKAGLDDSGEVYCNGVKLRELPYKQADFMVKFHLFDFSKQLRGGKNILAFEARNDVARGGLILRGTIEFASGKKMVVVSDDSFKAVKADKSNNLFYRMDFDDSKWKPAWAFGDVSASPWNRLSDVFNVFTSDEEKAAYKQALADAAKLPEGINSEPQSRARVVYKNNMATLELNGKTVAPYTYIVGNDPWNMHVADQLIKLNGAGVKIFEYQTMSHSMLRGENDYDFSMIDRDVKRVLSLAPDARLLISLRFDLFSEWLKNNPDDVIGYTTGKADNMDDIERRMAPSMASDKFRAEIFRFTTAFVQYLQSKPWYKRVIGIRTSHGVYSEWHYYGMANHMPDTGKAMTAAFKDFLRKKYKTDAALAAAWQTPGLTFDKVTVPNAAERRGDSLYLRNPALGRDRKVMDYYLCHSQVVADTLLTMAGAVKKVDPQLLVGAYYGYCFGFPYPAEGATLELEKVLSSKNIDFLSAPFCYDAGSRNVDGDSLSRGINYTFRRHGKLFMYESDTRTHLTRARTFGNARTPRESAETLLRTFAQSMTIGSGLQLLDLEKSIGRMWFNHPAILTAVNKAVNTYPQVLAARKAAPEDIAVVFSPLDVLQHDRTNTRQLRDGINMALCDNVLHALNRSGYSYELMTLHDYLDNKNDYKVVIFMNCFTLNAAERQALQAKSLRKDRTAIWCYAPGMVSENGWSEQAMFELTGIKLKYTTELRDMVVILDGQDFVSLNFRLKQFKDAPSVYSVDPQAKILARYLTNDAASVVKVLPNGAKSIFLGLPPNDYRYWQKVLAQTPVKPIAPGGLVMNKSGNAVYVYTAKKGEWDLTLPENTVDLFGSKVQFVNGKIRLKSDGPKCFMLISR